MNYGEIKNMQTIKKKQMVEIGKERKNARK